MNQPTYTLKPEQIPAHVRYAHELGRGMLLPQQIDELVKAINPEYVETKQKLTYLAQHQARAEMNRIFGYGNWDVESDEPILLYETQQSGATDSKLRWTVAYRVRTVVNIRDLWGMPVATFTGLHAEENAPQPNRGEAHALALTSVDSYALRRALINLGDRFGLGLYDGGKTQAHGKYTIQQPGNPNVGPGALYTWSAEPGAGYAAIAPPSGATAAQAMGRMTASPKMERFHNVQQAQQAARDEQRAGAASRLQQGLNYDAPPVQDDVTMTSQQYAQGES